MVLSESEHVMLISEGAMRFADHCGVPRVPDNYFYTPDRIEQLEKARLQHKKMLDHDGSHVDGRHHQQAHGPGG